MNFDAGTVVPFNKLQLVVHSHVASGGFSSVYIVKSESDTFILKSTSVPPDPNAYQNAINEIEILKMAKGNPHIVQLYDFKVNTLSHGGYEILLLLEYCALGSVVDLMNKKKAFNEPEIIRIFNSVCHAVEWLHGQGIIHRDLKVENVLYTGQDFKLCDFGSATRQIIPKGVNLSIEQIRIITDQVNKYTTMQYRAPEICDLFHQKGITNKIDIWALGTTPFEESGKLAILNGKYVIPSTPVYSKNLIILIQTLLMTDQDQRPDISQTLQLLKQIQSEIPITLLSNAFMPKSPKSLLQKKSSISVSPETNITPMRRGRPERSEDSRTEDKNNNFWDNWSATQVSRNNTVPNDFAEFDPLYSGKQKK